MWGGKKRKGMRNKQRQASAPLLFTLVELCGLARHKNTHSHVALQLTNSAVTSWSVCMCVRVGVSFRSSVPQPCETSRFSAFVGCLWGCFFVTKEAYFHRTSSRACLLWSVCGCVCVCVGGERSVEQEIECLAERLSSQQVLQGSSHDGHREKEREKCLACGGNLFCCYSDQSSWDERSFRATNLCERV